MGSSTKTVTNVPPPSKAELELQNQNLALSKEQLALFKEQAAYQKQLYDLASPVFQRERDIQAAVGAAITPEMQAQMQLEDFQRAQRLGPIQDELLQLQLENVRRGGMATDEQSAAIDRTTDASISAGEADLDRASELGLERIRNTLAPSRGFRPDDSPIVDRGLELERETLAQKGGLQKSLRAGASAAKLNFGAGVSSLAQQPQMIAQALKDFQTNLGLEAQATRMKYLGLAGGSGVSTINAGGDPYSYSSSLAQSRVAGAGSRTKGGGFGIGEVGQLAAGIGALAAFSDRRLKVDYGVVGKTKKGIPLHLFRYKGETAPRVGPMADEMKLFIPDAVVKDPQTGFDIVDMGRLE